jgi:glucan phosphoethanolaminetransferase (alkaline phosphatase superfamily)
MEKRCALVIYLSDHGESLGEDGYWLHAAGAEETKNPACLIWYSDRFAQLYPDKIETLHANKNNRYRTDFLFHSILSAAGIVVANTDSTINIFQTYHH